MKEKEKALVAQENAEAMEDDGISVDAQQDSKELGDLLETHREAFAVHVGAKDWEQARATALEMMILERMISEVVTRGATK